MNIAHLLPSTAVFPLKKHNGRYEWALRLARIQAVAGHDVTIYAGVGSSDDSTIVWQSLPPQSEDKKENNLALLKKAFSNHSHDIFHSHFDSLHYLVADLTNKPVIVTQHWFPTQAIADAVQYNTSQNVITVPVTDLMKQVDTQLGIPSVERIYHGIDLSLFSPSADHTDRFLFVGRIHPGKGVSEAISYAKQSGVPLDIIGKVNQPEQAYWEALEKDVDGDRIRYLGQKSHAEVASALCHAKALLFPSKATEAFGQVTVEAQASGTPVIISDLGASGELVVDGKTGFVCNDASEFLHAIQHIDTIDRNDCRIQAQKFDLSAMVSQYDALYRRSITAR